MSDLILQGTPEWDAQRAGKLTASRFHEAIAKLKDGSWGASRENYRADLVADRMRRGPPPQSYVNAAMQWGIDTELRARAAYLFYHDDFDFTEIGFVDHPTIPMSGCSPDGFVGDEGLVEFKCPNTATHLRTLLTTPAQIKSAYRTQMMWQMCCTKRKWCDFVSFDPRLDEEYQLDVKRITFDALQAEKLEHEAKVFLREVDSCIEALRQLRPALAA